MLREFVQDRLKKEWSPVQICQGLRREFPQDPERHLVPETIYQAADGVAGRIDGPTPAAPAGW